MESERRHATVLFADVSGFTSMSEKMDPEDVVEIMNRCFAVLEQAVLHHGGHVDKYEGDCIMATFGAPTAIENTARAAVNTAIEMRNAIRELRSSHHAPTAVDIHIGVNTGLVLAGEVGGSVKRDFTVMGDTVNLAARLKDASPTGRIWVGPDTYRFTRAEFEYEVLAPLTLKNKAKPVPVFELRSLKERRHRGGADRAVSSGLVGREREIEQVKGCVTRVRAGQGGILSIVGDAGIGKSRLVADVLALDEMREAHCLEGRSLSIGRTLSFHPFVDLLKRWAGVTEDDGESAALGKLEAAVTALMGDATSEVLPFVATLMGMRLPLAHAERVAGIEGEVLEKLILKSMRDLLHTLAHARPLVLAFEDLHWADESSVSLLEGLLRLAVESPILFLLIFRPDPGPAVKRLSKEMRERHPGSQTEILLEPLDLKQCDLLIQNILKIPNLPYSLRAEITRKGEGNPFFIEEIVRGLVDAGAIRHENGVFALTEKIDSAVIPGTIQEVIMARIDHLSPSAKSVIQVAAVIGRIFPHRIIAAISQMEARSLEWELQHLKRRQLIVERRAQGELQYIFKHALIQETIYESIVIKARKTLHLKVAEVIESLFASRLTDHYGMLAYHYSRADNLEKAEDYLFKAGDEAARAAASTEALHFFREASRIYFAMHGEGGDPQRKALLEKSIGLALLNKGNLLESIDHFNRALGFLGEPVPRRMPAVVRRFVIDLGVLLVRLYAARGTPPVGREKPSDVESLEIRYNRARAQTTSDTKRLFFDTIGSVRRLSQTDPAAIDQACGMYAGAAAAFAYAGISFRISRRFLTVARALIRQGSVRDLFVLRAYQFLVDYFEGNWTEDAAIEPELVDQALRYGQAWDVNTYLGLHCEQAIVQGAFERAGADVELLGRMAEEYGFEFARSNQSFMPACVLLERRQFAAALEALDRYRGSRHEDALNLLALGTRARIQTLAGDRAGAAATLSEAGPMATRLVPPYHLSAYRLSRFLFDVTGLEEALEGSDTAVKNLAKRARASGKDAVAVAAKIARDWTQVYRLAGRLSWLLSKQDAALRWWTRSVAAGERLQAMPELARTYLEIGRRLGEQQSEHKQLNGLGSAEFLAKAKQIFLALKLELDLEELEARRAA